MNLRINTLIFLLTILSYSTKGQAIEDHIFLKPDKNANCAMLKKGKFLSVKYDSIQYYLIANNDIVTEYVSDGKYFIKTKREFLNKCKYRSTIVEVTIPNYNMKVGDTITTEILETECDFVKIRIKMGATELTTVLVKQIE